MNTFRPEDRNYFVAYQYSFNEGKTNYFENREIRTKRDVVTYKDVQELLINEIERQISLYSPCSFTVCLLNWKKVC